MDGDNGAAMIFRVKEAWNASKPSGVVLNGVIWESRLFSDKNALKASVETQNQAGTVAWTPGTLLTKLVSVAMFLAFPPPYLTKSSVGCHANKKWFCSGFANLNRCSS